MQRFRRRGLVSLFVLVLVTSALAGPSPEAIESATTAADHEAIAAAYDGEAKELRAKANQHRQMARRYRKPASFKGSQIGGAMEAHCKRLAASYDQAADATEALAADHREMGKEVSK